MCNLIFSNEHYKLNYKKSARLFITRIDLSLKFKLVLHKFKLYLLRNIIFSNNLYYTF